MKYKRDSIEGHGIIGSLHRSINATLGQLVTNFRPFHHRKYFVSKCLKLSDVSILYLIRKRTAPSGISANLLEQISSEMH